MGNSFQIDYFKLAMFLTAFYSCLLGTDLVQFLVVEGIATPRAIAMGVIVLIGIAAFFISGAIHRPMVFIRSFFAKSLASIAGIGVVFGIIF